ncbi:MAG: hypothetical protein WC997_10600 [Porticoccaceae bacterium]
MSEYQYYEFAAIDRPLSQQEMTELRAVSSRARITPVSFVNHYEWGDLKAEPRDWMRRYFDAFVYFADWCNCWLALRLPKALFRRDELQLYALEHSLLIDATKEHWVLHWTLDDSENYDRFATEDGRGWMGYLSPLREELLRGDLRPLYLGWLAGARTLAGDKLEPPVPQGLAKLSSAQQALAQFLEIDPDLLAAASAHDASPPLTDDAANIDTWLHTWSSDDLKAVVRNIASGKGQEVERQVRSKYAIWLRSQSSLSSTTATRRTVAELLEVADQAAAARRKSEAMARKQQENALRQQRERHLRQMMAQAQTQWKAANAQASRGVASGYDQAVRLLSDLAEGYTLTASRAEFDVELQRFVAPHAKRKALLQRLINAGLWPR